MNKTCLDCKYISFSQASPGYSEWTPGYDADLNCMKSHWVYDAYNENIPSLRNKLYMALECKDFKKDPYNE